MQMDFIQLIAIFWKEITTNMTLSTTEGVSVEIGVSRFCFGGP